MPEPGLTALLVLQVLTEVQEGGGVDRAIRKLHPERLEDADAITACRANQEWVDIHQRFLDTRQAGADRPYAGRSSRQAGLVRCFTRRTTESGNRRGRRAADDQLPSSSSARSTVRRGASQSRGALRMVDGDAWAACLAAELRLSVPRRPAATHIAGHQTP
jgi:hypothetical protein